MPVLSLERTRGYYLAVLAAVVISLPTLGFGFFGDDYLHLTSIAGRNELASPLDIFVFGTGNAEQMRPYLESGPYPWFMDPEFKAHFFRPLSSALMTLDHRLFGHFAPAYHFHSIVWYVLLCVGAMLVLRRTLSPSVAALALILFVVDEAHAFPVAWWSNRNSVVAVALGFWGIAAHLRWREDAWRPGLPLSLAAFTGALLASESGLGTLAFVLAYEMFGTGDTPGVRCRRILPASLLAAGYLVVYQLGGYGAQFSDIYIDPGQDPLRYLMTAPARFLMLAGAQLFMVPCEASLLRPALEPLFIFLGMGSLAIVAAAMYLLWPGLDKKEQRTLRWLVPGALLATTPSLAAIVTSRVLLAPSLGGAVVVAVILVQAWRRTPLLGLSLSKQRLMRFLMWIFIIMHLFISAVSWPVQVTVLRGLMNHLNAIMRDSEIDETRIADSQIVVMNAPDPYTGVYPVMLRDFDGLPRARSWWLLSMAPFAQRYTRTGERTLEMEVLGGQLCTTPIEQLFHSVHHPFRIGDRYDLNGLIITVLQTGDTGPSRVQLEFEEPPESIRYQILAFKDGVYRRIQPPAMGQSIELPFELP